jgi:outer membrane protein OmpA-like peptidoglycan-associated protein
MFINVNSKDIIDIKQQQSDTIKIVFDINKSIIDNNNAKLLDKLINNKAVTSISIYGYTDFLGDVVYNQELSEKRSTNVFNYLISKGINRGKILIVKGDGIYPNSAEANRQDLSDRGIQEHRIVQVVYTNKLQNAGNNTKLSEENLVVNNNIVLENILFHGGNDVFLPDSYPALEELLKIKQKYHTLKIEIQGHICCKNKDLYDEPVSLNRAKAVYDYLVKNNIDASRLTYKAFGATRKIYPLEQNENERMKNRRVEILILEK